ncbi:MAG: HAD family hydrolase [Proteobacteria bacterium]|nr:HAD family hydrolase [Pseudomonadota bacterium]MBS0462435.1 HAD family hydrolase [Pseudomonadota bacterium]
MLSTEAIILLDVDNTLFDNDRFKDDLAARLLRDFGPERAAIYWRHYEAVRGEVGYVDYLAALQRLRLEIDETPELLAMSSFLLDYPFADHLYAHALEAIAHLRTIAAVAIFSDGDIVFQPRKIQRAGLWDAVQGRVLVTVHKERSIDALRARFPAAHYVMVDDKPQLLAAMKRVLGDGLTTVFVRQGHYAADAAHAMPEPAPDRVVERIGDLCQATGDWLRIPAPAAVGGT